MVLPNIKEHFKSSSKYGQMLSELEFNYAFSKTNEERIKLLDDFSGNYLMPHQLWYVRLTNFKALETDFEDALGHFCNDSRIQKSNFYQSLYILQCGRNEELEIDGYSVKMSPYLKMYTEFPHECIRYYFMKYEEKISTPLSEKALKKIETFEILYWKIIKANNVETWFEYLEEVDNYEFLKQNVENRLCFNLWDKTLWKLYIDYLKIVNPCEMLHVYSKYCRYFLEDFYMFEKYKQEVALHGPIYVTWHNPFYFETIGYYRPDQSSFNIEMEDESMAESYDELDDSFKWYHQRWSIPSPMIRHIYTTANHKILSKLHLSCKYFFKRKPQFICYKFVAKESDSYSLKMERQSAAYSFKESHLIKMKKWNITTVFDFRHNNSHMLTSFIHDSLFQCNARYIKLLNQLLSLKEFLFLVGHGNVEKLKLEETFVVKENDEYLNLHETLKLVPRIRSFLTDTVALTSQNTINLSQLPFLNKFTTFGISFVKNGILDIGDICTFIKKNAAPFSYFEILCDEDFPFDILNIYQAEVENFFKDWEINDGKPIVYIHNGF